jgi:hypothetical protein
LKINRVVGRKEGERGVCAKGGTNGHLTSKTMAWGSVNMFHSIAHCVKVETEARKGRQRQPCRNLARNEAGLLQGLLGCHLQRSASRRKIEKAHRQETRQFVEENNDAAPLPLHTV